MSVARLGRLIVDVQRAARRRRPRAAVYLLVYLPAGGRAVSMYWDHIR